MDMMLKFLWAGILFMALSALVWYARRPLRRARRRPGSQPIVVPQGNLRAGKYPYVFVNEDGSVRELHVVEKQYLEMPFYVGDPQRPEVKLNYEQRNARGGFSGYLRRSAVPVLRLRDQVVISMRLPSGSSTTLS